MNFASPQKNNMSPNIEQVPCVCIHGYDAVPDDHFNKGKNSNFCKLQVILLAIDLRMLIISSSSLNMVDLGNRENGLNFL